MVNQSFGASYFNFAYSALAAMRIGISGSASFQSVRKSGLGLSPCICYVGYVVTFSTAPRPLHEVNDSDNPAHDGGDTKDVVHHDAEVDTFTGVACVDWLADALLTLAEQPPLEGNWYDTNGRLRVWMPSVRLERLVKLAFDQIRQASATTPAVLIRQLDAIRRLAPRLPEACRRGLSDQADAILETASALVALDRRNLEEAWNRTNTALVALPRTSSGNVSAAK
jgi:Predicted membrane protein (DUF2254)